MRSEQYHKYRKCVQGYINTINPAKWLDWVLEANTTTRITLINTIRQYRTKLTLQEAAQIADIIIEDSYDQQYVAWLVKQAAIYKAQGSKWLDNIITKE